MRLIKRLFFPATLLFLFACHQSKPDLSGYTLFSDQDFGNPVELHGKQLTKFKLKNPRYIHIVDSLLITVDRKTDYLLHVYSIKTGKEINKLIRRGKGPDELVRLSDIQKEEKERKILAFGSSQKKVLEFSYDDLLKDEKDIHFHHLFIHDQGCLGLMKNGPDYAGFGVNDSIVNRFYLYDNDGHLVKGVGEYPSLVPLVGHMLDGVLFSANGTILPGKGIVMAYGNMDLIEIYDKNYQLKKSLWGPDRLLPEVKLESENNTQWLRFSKDNKDAYGDAFPDMLNHEFWVSYSGRTLQDKGYLKSKLYSFGDDGSFRKHYNLDTPVLAMYVDFRRRKVYGLSYPEMSVYEFDF